MKGEAAKTPMASASSRLSRCFSAQLSCPGADPPFGRDVTTVAISDLLRGTFAQEAARPEDHQDAEDDGIGPLGTPTGNVLLDHSVAHRPDEADQKATEHRSTQVSDAAQDRSGEGEEAVAEAHLGA